MPRIEIPAKIQAENKNLLTAYKQCISCIQLSKMKMLRAHTDVNDVHNSFMNYLSRGREVRHQISRLLAFHILGSQ